MTGASTIHACALVIGEAGILIRGPSGGGKSSLTLAVIAAAQAQGRFARLVADDRVALRVAGGRLIASPHPAIAGQIEERGTGILEEPHAEAARICLVVDLVDEIERLPTADGEVELLGVELRHARIAIGLPAETAAGRLLRKI